MRLFVSVWALAVFNLVSSTGRTQALGGANVEEAKNAFNTVVSWHQDALVTRTTAALDISRLKDPKTGRCFTPAGKIYWSMLAAEERIVGVDKGPGFPRTTESKVHLWGAWAYQNEKLILDQVGETKDVFIKNHFLQWMWAGTSIHRSRDGELTWTFDVENNKRPDIEFSALDNGKYIIVLGKNLIKQDYPLYREYMRNYYSYYTQFFGDGPKHAVGVNEAVVACYYFADMVFK